MSERTDAHGVVLVPVDFEEASRSAIELAKSLAPCFHADVVLLHTFRLLAHSYPGLPPANAPPWPGFFQEVAVAAQKALEQLAAAHGGLRTILVEGDPAQEILAEAARLRPHLIVMGTHGRTGLEHLMLGSVAEKVIRQSTVPVAVVRAPGR
jgi:nucleotide-binding universal stress UspA family protein